MTHLSLWLALLGGLILVLGLGAGRMRRHGYLPSEPIIAVAVGIAIGPFGLDILHVTPLREPLSLLKHVAWLTVAFAVTSIALRLPPSYLRERATSFATILGPGMVLMWVCSSAVIYAVLPIDVLPALLVGASVTPTDPVLANSIVVGETATENIPQRLRRVLSGEAGLNDGIAYLFVFLPILVAAQPIDAALSAWLTQTVVWEVMVAVTLGFVAGSVVGVLERWESAQNFLEGTSVFTITVALTIFVLGVTKLAGTDAILAVFVTAVAYNWQADVSDEAEQQQVQEVFNRLFTIPVFVLFGMSLPWSGWAGLGWRGPALLGGILIFRRLPMVLALRRGIQPLDRPEDTLFVGWFGPIGIAAVYYALLTLERTGVDTVWIVASLIVAGSVLIHGLTATPATQLYAALED